jgi:hypothetical protein
MLFKTFFPVIKICRARLQNEESPLFHVMEDLESQKIWKTIKEGREGISFPMRSPDPTRSGEKTSWRPGRTCRKKLGFDLVRGALKRLSGGALPGNLQQLGKTSGTLLHVAFLAQLHVLVHTSLALVIVLGLVSPLPINHYPLLEL